FMRSRGNAARPRYFTLELKLCRPVAHCVGHESTPHDACVRVVALAAWGEYVSSYFGPSGIRVARMLRPSTGTCCRSGASTCAGTSARGDHRAGWVRTDDTAGLQEPAAGAQAQARPLLQFSDGNRRR